MSDKPGRPQNRLVEDGLKLSARLALGLATIPLMGIALLGRERRERAPEQDAAAPSSSSATPPPEQPGETQPASDASSEGPRRAEIESALHQLTEATLPKRSRQKRSAAAEPASERKPRSKSSVLKLH